jgi:NADPH2:quinone reductase
LYATRPTLFTYIAKREDLTAMAAELFELVLAGRLVSEPRQSFALKDAAGAHIALESRATMGATVLLP